MIRIIDDKFLMSNFEKIKKNPECTISLCKGMPVPHIGTQQHGPRLCSDCKIYSCFI